MRLLNTKVIHKSLGNGIVKAQDEKHITVEFSTKTCTFQYPEAFRNFLIIEDEKSNEIVLSEIAASDAKLVEEKEKLEEARKAEEKKKLEELMQKVKNRGTGKLIKRVERVKGQSMTFLVFQGNTFDAEYRGGFIWAPKYNQGGLPVSGPIVFDRDIRTGQASNLTYGVYKSGLDSEANMIMNIPFGVYMDNFPDEKNGLWGVLKIVYPGAVDIDSIKEKYSNVERKYVRH